MSAGRALVSKRLLSWRVPHFEIPLQGLRLELLMAKIHAEGVRAGLELAGRQMYLVLQELHSKPGHWTTDCVLLTALFSGETLRLQHQEK
eukprot:COSAG02_NODE_16960_length_1040_cov_1.416578_1_plen_90_part_00